MHANAFGAGIFLQNEEGTFIKAKTPTCSGNPTPKIGEAWALHEALTWIKEMGIQKSLLKLIVKILLIV